MIKYLIAIFLTTAAAYSQTIKTLGYNTTNGQVAYSGSNTLTFTNPLGFSNAATTRTNLGLGSSWLTNSNSPATTNATNLTAGTLPDARLSTNVAILSNLPSWATTTNSATARTNLGLGAAKLAPTITNITNAASLTLNSASALEANVFFGGAWGSTNIITLPTNNPQHGDLVTLTFQRSSGTDPLIVTNTGGLGGPWYVYLGNIASWTYDTNGGPARWQPLGRTIRSQVNYLGDTAADTRTNLGINVASNLPLPYSGAATTNSLLTADGAGGSSFVASRSSISILTSNVVRTNWTQTGADKVTNDTGLRLNYDANAVYRLKWLLFIQSSWSNISYGLAFSYTNSYAVRNGYQLTPVSSTPSSATLAAGVTNVSLVTDSTTSGLTNVNYVGGEFTFIQTNAGTVNLRMWTGSSSTNTTTLFSNSLIQLEKIYP